MSVNGYIFDYLYYNGDPITKGKTKIAIILIIILLLLLLCAIFNPIEFLNDMVEKKNEQLAGNKILYCSDGSSITYSGKFPEPMQGVVSKGYGEYREPITNNKKYHTGVDIAGKDFDKVITIADGIVTEVDLNNKEFGKTIEIKHVIDNKTFYTYYAGLSEVTVMIGQNLKQGYIIGKGGGNVAYSHFDPGISSNRNIHFEVRESSGIGNDINPNSYIFVQ